MWVFSLMSFWLLLNMTVIDNHIKKITEGKNRSYFTAGVFIYLFIYLFIYVFLVCLYICF